MRANFSGGRVGSKCLPEASETERYNAETEAVRSSNSQFPQFAIALLSTVPVLLVLSLILPLPLSVMVTFLYAYAAVRRCRGWRTKRCCRSGEGT